MDGYGAIQIGMCIMLLPTTAFFVIKQLRDLRSDLASDAEGGETKESNKFTNPLDDAVKNSATS